MQLRDRQRPAGRSQYRCEKTLVLSSGNSAEAPSYQSGCRRLAGRAVINSVSVGHRCDAYDRT